MGQNSKLVTNREKRKTSWLFPTLSTSNSKSTAAVKIVLHKHIIDLMCVVASHNCPVTRYHFFWTYDSYYIAFALHSKRMIFDQKPDKSIGAAGVLYKCYPANKSRDINFISRGNPVRLPLRLLTQSVNFNWRHTSEIRELTYLCDYVVP